ncbi:MULTISPECIES: hypothetical protein [unclassified Mesorhizobium]|uniref:hypothetical protein n=1 Tax=unclassified Mesorhizobium TaxID=325217 RepID=UPI00112EDE3C|nr:MULTISPECIES: hypothetical protein [unclassified Mesorhizobium]MBZ9739541.1 hypothetical protein [Mesorhizobium sp. CO1-1-4]MBZ9801645.1 hypothetical protein [Mesorhizobium sp. ES1-6]TPL91258.1 hypothetical protein FJ948_17530 [Mesorhizobium sp. B2-3-12]
MTKSLKLPSMTLRTETIRPAKALCLFIYAVLDLSVSTAIAKDDPSKLSVWTVARGKDESGASRITAMLNPWVDDPSTVTHPVSAMLLASCTEGSLSVALISDIGVDGQHHDIFIRRNDEPEKKERWVVSKLLPGIWDTKEAGIFLDSLSEVGDLSIRYEDTDKKWVRVSKYKMTNFDKAKEAIRSMCPW